MNGRKAIGAELKPSYFAQAKKNVLFTIEHGWTEKSDQETLFADQEDEEEPDQDVSRGL